MWETLIINLFILTHQVNGKVVDEPNFFWTKEEKRKFKIDFKIKSFIVMSLDDIKFLYVYNFKTAKEMWDTLEMIYGVSSSIK